ncbi:MAG: hypothetical protein GVY15_13235 [Bacteroidetes bacterium]|jgi:hypothetical protein|nr:hypothetical protein [Bacteroidota bacterium]
MRLSVPLAACLLLLTACTTGPPDAEALIDDAIAAHGMQALDDAAVSFTFRDEAFTVARDGGTFAYTRSFEDDTGRRVVDTLSNDGLARTVDGEPVDIPEDEHGAALTAVNSVVYFALLPYFLQDPAVEARYLGADTVRAAPYHQVEVTFAAEDGGPDYEDRFVYWFHAEARTMDYLAYYFHTEDGGSRLRIAENPRTVAGIRFQDYGNYEAPHLTEDTIERYGHYVGTDSLQRISDVALHDIAVELQ